MDSVSTSLQPAYILHYTEFRETSLIVDAFTLTHGCVSMVARSARASRPAVRSLYQPFRPLLLSWIGAEGLRTLTGIEESGSPVSIEDAELACAYYINELLLRLLGKDQPQQLVFAHYALALAELASAKVPYEVVLRTFELQMLDALGELPNLTHCTPDGRNVEADCNYLFHVANALAVPVRPATGESLLKQKNPLGGELSLDPTVHPDGITKDKGIPVSGNTLIAMSQLDFTDPTVLQEARTLMRHILKAQLGDKPLKSRDLFHTLNPKGRTTVSH